MSPVTDLNGLENKPISPDSVEDAKIQSMQILKKEMLKAARGEQKAPTDAGNISFESVEAARAWVVRNTDDLSAHGRDIANTGIAGAEFDATNPVKKSLLDVLAKFAKFSPAFISEGRGDQKQDRIISNRDRITCPVCGSAKLVHDTRDMPYTYKGQSTNIPALIGDYCPACTKFIFDLDEARRAMNLMREFENKVDGK